MRAMDEWLANHTYRFRTGEIHTYRFRTGEIHTYRFRTDEAVRLKLRIEFLSALDPHLVLMLHFMKTALHPKVRGGNCTSAGATIRGRSQGAGGTNSYSTNCPPRGESITVGVQPFVPGGFDPQPGKHLVWKCRSPLHTGLFFPQLLRGPVHGRASPHLAFTQIPPFQLPLRLL